MQRKQNLKQNLKESLLVIAVGLTISLILQKSKIVYHLWLKLFK